MPTRSGLDFHRIRPSHFICSYCYKGFHGSVKYEGMQRKRVYVRVDDEDGSAGVWVMVPGEWTEIWTTKHCWSCHRKVVNLPSLLQLGRKFTYSADAE